MKKRITLFISCCLLLFFQPLQLAFAEEASGKLKFNNQVIYDTNNQNRLEVEISFIIQDLFLPEKNKVVDELQKKQEEVVSQSQKMVFVTKEKVTTEPIEKKVRPYLFRDAVTEFPQASVSTDKETQTVVNTFWLYGGIAAGGFAVLFFGVFLGKKFSYHRSLKNYSRSES